MIISERIFKRIEELGMTQKDFANRTGITPSTISDWKNKKTNPASDKIAIICDALQMTPNELISGTDARNHNWNPDYIMVDVDTKDYHLIEQFRSLDAKSQERLLGYIDALIKDQ